MIGSRIFLLALSCLTLVLCVDSVLAADKVFEHGFDHLAGGFDAGLAANEVFSQWISVLPTDQIVAVEYEPTDLIVE